MKINRTLEDVDWNVVLEGNEIVCCVESFNRKLHDLLSKHVSLKICSSNEYSRWFTAELRH